MAKEKTSKTGLESAAAPARFNAKEAFESSRHADVVANVTSPDGPSDETTALICSLAFLGRLEEAVAYWNVARSRLPGAERARVRFAIALALTRISKFKSAKKYLLESLEDQECQNCADVFHGIALFHFYRGQFKKATGAARKALRLALENNDKYMRAIATDLLGHALCQSGRRSAGTRLLSQAQVLLGLKGQADAISTERLMFEARAGLRPETIIFEIKQLLETRGAHNFYTRASLTLEFARQLTLRGQWEEAKKLLNQEAGKIYEFENKRQEATLQLRLAEIAFRQGDGAVAKHFLQGARRCVDIIADRGYEIRILGLEDKIERVLFGGQMSAAHRDRLDKLSRDFPNPTNSRILNRARKAVEKVLPHGEDPLGDLLDSVTNDPIAGARELLKVGYLGLWPEAVGMRPGEERLVIFESGEWIGVRKSAVIRGTAPISQTSRKILGELAKGIVGKKELLERVWGYEYDPLRHDAMIYAALTSLRKSLGEMVDWVETHQDGWAIGPCLLVGGGEVQYVSPEPLKLTPVEKEPARIATDIEKKPFFAEERHTELNWRQIKVLNELMDERGGKSRWTAPLHREAFGVSLMTAWRDLDDLVKKRYLLRVGHGRLTAYVKGKKLKSSDEEES